MHEPVDIFEGTQRFELRRKLGEGAFGVVYEAHDVERDEVVALKTLQNASPAALYRFKREFRELTHIVHPNLVALYELKQAGSAWFFTMEYIEGEDFLSDLRRRMSAAPIDTADEDLQLADTLDQQSHVSSDASDVVMRQFSELAHALRALHDSGKIHRDIKPGNVRVEASTNRVVLLDFGLVTSSDVVEGRESEGIKGTPAYMAPEQALGKPLTVAADWYAFGVMLFEALTGELPFTGPTVRVMLQKQGNEVPEPGPLAAFDVPKELSGLCLALLSPKREERPAYDEIVSVLRPAERPPRPAPPAGESSERPAFIGRRGELAALREAFDATRDGEPVVALVDGQPGIGKSTLIDGFLRELRHTEPDCVVLRGRCYQQEEVPYKGIDAAVDELSRYLERLDEVDITALLPRNVHALCQLFGVLRRIPTIEKAPRVVSAAAPTEIRRRAVDALRELLARLADRKRLVIYIDDIQWGDADSGALLQDLLNPGDAPAALFIGSYRTDDRDESPMIQALLDEPQFDTTEVHIGPFGRDECTALAETVVGIGGEVVERVMSESGGNPLFAAELLEHFAENPDAASGPVPLHQLLLRRVKALGREDRELVELLCVAGRPLPNDALQERLTAGKLRSLRAGRFLRMTEVTNATHVEVYHDRIREAVGASLDAARRVACHATLVGILEARPAPDPEQLAEHLLGAGMTNRAVPFVIEAARRARGALAFDRAAQLYGRALDIGWEASEELPTNEAISREYADALVSAGRLREAADVYLENAETYPGRATDDIIDAAVQLLRTAEFERGMELLDTALKQVGLSFVSNPSQLQIAWEFARWRFRGTRFEVRDPHEIPERERLRMKLFWYIAHTFSQLDLHIATYYSLVAARYARQIGSAWHIATTSATLLAGSSQMEGPDVGGDLRDTAERLSAELDDPYPAILVKSADASRDWSNGRVQDAMAKFRECERELRECASTSYVDIVYARMLLSAAASVAGEVEIIVDDTPRWVREAKQLNDEQAVSRYGVWGTSLAHCMRGDFEDARETIRRAREIWDTPLFGETNTALRVCASVEMRIEQFAWSPQTAIDRFEALRRNRRSPQWRIIPLKAEFLDIAAACYVQAALLEPDRADPLLRKASRLVDELQKIQLTRYQRVHAPALAGCIAAARGETDEAARVFESACVESRALGMPMHVLLYGHALATVRDDHEALAETLDGFRGLGVVAAEQLIAAMAPVYVP